MAFDKTAKGTADGLGAFSAKLMVLGKCEGSDIDFDALDRAGQDSERRGKTF